MSIPQKNYIQVGRVRSIKPEFFTHEGLFDLEMETKLPIRLAFAGLWTQCDREGRFRWQPRRLKTHILPYDECDFPRVLDALATRGFVVRYEKAGVVYGWIPSFLVHQYINNREQPSIIPPADDEGIGKADIQRALPGLEDATFTRRSRVDDATATPLVQERGEGKGREGNIDTTTLSSSSVSPQLSKVVGNLPMRNGRPYPITMEDLEKYQKLYPHLDASEQFEKMTAWLEANPARKKKPAGMKRFILNWFQADRSNGTNKKSKTVPSKEKDFVGGRKKNSDGSHKL